MAFYYLLRSSALILTGLLIYTQTFHFGFVFDDHIFIVANPFIKNFSNIHVMWHAFPVTRLVGMYSFALNYYFNQLHPEGYHVFNFIVHMVAVGLVWALADLLFRITKPFPAEDRFTKEIPFIIALLFLVHPCQTQAVTYVTQRFESMATVFYLATIYTYLCARLSKDKIRQFILFGLAGVLTLWGLMTKEVMITVPAMILALEWILFPNKNNKNFCIVLVVGGILLGVLFTKMIHAGLGVLFASFPSESHDGDLLTPAHYLLTQMRVFLTFLRLLVLPIHQNLDYDYPASIGFLHPPLTLFGFGVIAGMVFLIIKFRCIAPLISLGLAWILITFSINLAPRSNVIFEHKLYLISFGFFLALMTALTMLVRDRGTLIRILFCIIAVLILVSFNRNKVWANELVLWENTIQESPNKARVNANLGRIYGSLGQYDKSIYYLSRAIAIAPDNITYENRGIIYSMQGRHDQALEDLNKSIAMDPSYFSTYIKRAWVYQVEHRNDAALADLRYAIMLEPDFSDGYIARGLLWMQLGNAQGAIDDFQHALSIDPLNEDVLLKQGIVYFSLGKYELALEDFNKAQSLEPANAQAAQYKAYCLAKMGR